MNKEKYKKIPSKKIQLKYLKQRAARLQKIKERIIKIYWEKIKDRPKYKVTDWYKK